jgi:hypothetical protein
MTHYRVENGRREFLGPPAGCARTGAGKDPTASPAMPPATLARRQWC